MLAGWLAKGDWDLDGDWYWYWYWYWGRHFELSWVDLSWVEFSWESGISSSCWLPLDAIINSLATQLALSVNSKVARPQQQAPTNIATQHNTTSTTSPPPPTSFLPSFLPVPPFGFKFLTAPKLTAYGWTWTEYKTGGRSDKQRILFSC